jgi:DNA polymerase (family X)
VLDRITIAAALRELGMLLSLKGENRFKIRAYERGAEALEALEEDLGTLVEQDRLTEISGIGQSLAGVIRELWQTGTSPQLERLRTEIPRGIVELSKLEGIGEAKIQALYEGLGIDTLEKLKEALDAGRVRELRGFGKKSEERIRTAIERYEHGVDRLLLADALVIGSRLLRHLRADPFTIDAEIAGELRRWHEVIDRIDLVAASTDPEKTAARFSKHPEVIRVELLRGGEASTRLAGGARAKLSAVSPERYPVELVAATGSFEHVSKLASRARAKGLVLPEIRAPSEEELYGLLGLAFVPPELREDLGEVERAELGELEPLVDVSDIRGMVHCHTTYSDGSGTIEEMARAADRLGVEYLTITDHSPTAHYAGGLEIDRLKRQWDEIAEVQERVKVKLLRGTESDILQDGNLDYPDAILEKLDIVIASIHTRHKMDEDAMTERVVRAMKHPCFKIWGHALGRLVLRRDPIPCRVEEVLDVIAEQRAAIEISGDPDRLELEPRWIRAARERGIKFVVSVDAHSTGALNYVNLGVHLARRGGATPKEVLNTLPVDEFLAAVRPAQAGRLRAAR